MALHPDFPSSPHAILDPKLRYFPPNEDLRLRAVAIYPPVTTKILSGLRVDFLGLGLPDYPDLFVGHDSILSDRLFVVSGIVKLP